MRATRFFIHIHQSPWDWLRPLAIGGALFWVFCWMLCGSLDALVISEIHYNPSPGNEELEFVEISNDTTTPEDISGYSFVQGIHYTFPPGTILHGSDVIVVCANVEAVKERYGIENAYGNFNGQLNSGGEELTLVNHVGIVVQSILFNDRGKWPVAPDGSGHSLSLCGIHLDTREPESWTQSLTLGGTPGRPNLQERVVIDVGEDWRFHKGTGPFSNPPTAWRAIDFDDSSWEVGPSGFGFGDDDHATLLEDMRGNYSALAIRKRFSQSQEEIEEFGEYFLAIKFDDGFCAYLNGTEIARANCGKPGEERAWDDAATSSSDVGAEELFSIPSELFQNGDNVLTIVGYNVRRNQVDFNLIPRLLFRSARYPSAESARDHCLRRACRRSRRRRASVGPSARHSATRPGAHR